MRKEMNQDLIADKETFSTSEYEGAAGVPNRTAKNHIKKMVDLGLLKKEGAGPSTRYRVIRA